MNDGFFSGAELVHKQPLPLVARCGACGFYKSCLSPKMPVAGKGRKGIMIVGEAPGECITGDSLIDTAFRDKSIYPKGIPIKDLVGKKNVKVYSFDTDTMSLTIGTVNRVWLVGRRKVYKVRYFWWGGKKEGGGGRQKYWKALKVTSNHPFMLNTGEYRSIDDGLAPGDSLMPFYRRTSSDGRGYVGTSSDSMTVEARLLLAADIGRPLETKEECHHKDRNPSNDRKKNSELLTTAEHARLHGLEDNAMFNPKHRESHKKAMADPAYRTGQRRRLKAYLRDPENYKKRLEQIQRDKHKIAESVKQRFKNDPCYYYRFLLGRQRCLKRPDSWVEEKFHGRFPDVEFPPKENRTVFSIEYVGVEEVYDMEVNLYHNFAVNGIFVHNSEDKRGKPFVGASGSELQGLLESLGFSLFRDCWVTNSAICRPPNNVMGKKTVEHCRPNLIQAVREYQPHTIILLGGSAIKSLIGWLWKEEVGPVARWAGFNIPNQRLNAWICPTWHPAHLLRMEKQQDIAKLIWKQHLAKALSHTTSPWKTPPDFTKRVEIIQNSDLAANAIRSLSNTNHPIAFDFETDRLKPDHPDAHILTCAMSDGKKAIAYPWVGAAIEATKQFLFSDTPKIGYNLKFEDRWTRRFFKRGVRNWQDDGMILAHVLDNRNIEKKGGGITSLKFQAFALLGVESWDDAVKPYMKASGNNLRNRLHEVSLSKLLFYNGLDALLEWHVAKRQHKLLERCSDASD